MKFGFVILALAAVHAAYAQLTLDRALALARANRPGVVAAEQRVASARQTTRSLGAFPSTRLSVGYTSDLEVGGSDDDLVLSQPLDVFGRTRAMRSVGEAGIARAEAELRQVLAEIQAQVIEEYSEAAAARELSESAKLSQGIAQQLYSAIAELVREGEVPGVQLTRVGIELERAKLAASQRDAEHRASLERLAGLLNVSVSEVEVPSFAELQVTPIQPAELRSRRADLLLLSAEVQSAEAEARVARLSNSPELEIQGRRTPWQERDQRYGLRLQLSFPLFDYGRGRAETAAANAKAEAARKVLADAARIAEAELAAAAVELASANEQIERYKAIAESARSLVERSRMGFTEGATTLIEMLEATRALREVEEGFVEARLRLARAQGRYLRASGSVLEGQR